MCDVVTGQKGHDVLAQGVLVKVLYTSFFEKKMMNCLLERFV